MLLHRSDLLLVLLFRVSHVLLLLPVHFFVLKLVGPHELGGCIDHFLRLCLGFFCTEAQALDHFLLLRHRSRGLIVVGGEGDRCHGFLNGPIF